MSEIQLKERSLKDQVAYYVRKCLEIGAERDRLRRERDELKRLERIRFAEVDGLKVERDELMERVEELEDSLELESIPGFVEKVQRRYKKLVDAGLIQPEDSDNIK